MDIAKIKPDPNQPRKTFSDSYIKKLANSIKQEGLIHPIEVDEKGTIIVGECRWRACKLLKLKRINVTVHKDKLTAYERLRRQMNENLVRTSSKESEQMNPMDVAKAYARLWELAMGKKFLPGRFLTQSKKGVDKGLTKIASEVGQSADSVNEYLRLLGETEKAQQKVQSGEIPRTVFREIERVPEEIREELKKDVVENWGTKYKSRDQVFQHVKALRNVSPEMRQLLSEHKKLKEEGRVSRRLVNGIIALGIIVGESSHKDIHPSDFNVVLHHIDWIQGELDKFRDKMLKSPNIIEGKSNP